MSAVENENVVLCFFENLSAGNLDAALALMDENPVWRVPGKPEQFPLAGTFNKVQFVEMLGKIGAAMPNGVQVTITGITAEDDRVAVEAETHGVSATGKV
jgi:ketosteroid isomerase-like protein